MDSLNRPVQLSICIKKNINIKVLFALFIFLLNASGAIAQQVLVRDKTTLKPIPKAEIVAGDALFTTGINGKANILSTPLPDSVVIRAMGYQDVKLSWLDLIKINYTAELQEREMLMNDVVISASRFEENQKDVPRQILILRSKDIGFMNQSTSADLLQNSGIVFVQKSQLGGGSPVLRGFEANKVLIVVDGVRMNNAIYRGGHLQNIITLDNASLERAEILFGPGSAVYGSDALGGVMHLTTIQPQFAQGNQDVLTANAFVRQATASGERTAHIDLKYGEKKWAYAGSFTISRFEDLMQGNKRNPFYGNWGKRLFYVERINGQDSAINNPNVNLQKQSGYMQYDLIEKLSYKASKKVILGLNLQLSNSSNIDRYDRLTETSGAAPRFAEWYYGPQKRLMGAFTINLTNQNWFYDKANIILSSQQIEESRHDRRFRSDTINRRAESVKITALNADFEKDLGKHEIRYGTELAYNDVQSKAQKENILNQVTLPVHTRYPDGGSVMQSIAAYLTHSWEINPKLILSDGIRFSHITLVSKFIDKTFFPFPFNHLNQQYEAFNGNFGLAYMPGKDWRFTANAASGFRAPNIDDMTKVFDSRAGMLIVPNPQLNPEYTCNAELGISKIIKQQIKLEGQVFYTRYVDALTTGKSTFNGADSISYLGQQSAVFTIVNKGEAYIYGGFAGIQADITPACAIYSSLTYTYGRIKTDSTDYPLDHIPPMFGKTGIQLKIRKFKGEFYAMYNGWKSISDYNITGEDNPQYATVDGTPAWYTLNIRCAFAINKHIQVMGALDNILDTNYRVFASGISAPGRNLTLTLRAGF